MLQGDQSSWILYKKMYLEIIQRLSFMETNVAHVRQYFATDRHIYMLFLHCWFRFLVTQACLSLPTHVTVSWVDQAIWGLVPVLSPWPQRRQTSSWKLRGIVALVTAVHKHQFRSNIYKLIHRCPFHSPPSSMQALSTLSKASTVIDIILTALECVSDERFWQRVFGQRILELGKRYFGNDFVLLSMGFYIACKLNHITIAFGV